MPRRPYHAILGVVLSAGFWVSMRGVQAQVVTDRTAARVATIAGPNYDINAGYGHQVGPNLFHSFSTFNIGPDETATFSGPTSVSRIFARVTGGSPSQIYGTIRSSIPGADLYLINPAGILFGQKAHIDVSGSFLATTADEVRLSDGGVIRSAAPESSVLTAAAPESFGFLRNQGKIIATRVAKPLTAASLTLAAAEIDVDNSKICSTGPANLVSVVNGQVDLTSVSGGLAAIATRTSQLGPLTVSADPAPPGILQFDGIDGMPVFLQGDVITLSHVIVGGLRSIDNVDVDLRAGTSISLFDAALRHLGSGSSGKMSLTAPDIRVDGQESFRFSGIVTTPFLGRGGDISITCRNLTILGGAEIDASSSNTTESPAGNITINALDTVTLNGMGMNRPFPTTIKTVGIAGSGGTVTLTADRLIILDQALIAAGAQGPDPAGNLIFKLNHLLIDGISASRHVTNRFTGISVQTGSQSDTATGGSIQIGSQFIGGPLDVVLKNGGRISASTYGVAKGGDITVVATSLDLFNRARIDSGSKIVPHGVDYPRREPTGNGGSVTLTANTLTLASRSSIDTEAVIANAGGITIDASQLLSVVDSSITTVAAVDAGNMLIKGEGLILIRRSVATTSAGHNGGFISIDPAIVILQDSTLDSRAHNVDQGIKVVAPFFVRSSDSNIFTEHPDFVVDTELAASLARLADGLLPPNAVLAEPCDVRYERNTGTFSSVGNGSIPLDAGSLLPVWGFLSETTGVVPQPSQKQTAP